MTRNHGGRIVGRGIIEEESLRREACGRHLGGIWEVSGTHLGGIWEAPWTPGGHGAPGGSESQKSMPSQLGCKSSIKILILHAVSEGQITKHFKLQSKMIDGSSQRSRGTLEAPPTDKSVWGKMKKKWPS
jgi:hypothetical protein